VNELDDFVEIGALKLERESQHADESLDDYAKTDRSLEDYQLGELRSQASFREASNSIFGCELGDDVSHEQELNVKSEVLKAFRNKYGDIHEGGELYLREGAIDLKYMPERAEARLEVDLDEVDPINVYCGENDANVGRVTGIRGEAPPEGNNGIR